MTDSDKNLSGELASARDLAVRLAQDEADVLRAQRLRYEIFYNEMSAAPTPAMAAERRDFDDYDAFADHLLVIDKTKPADEAVVGTYRLIAQKTAMAHGGFYSESEYNLKPMLEAQKGKEFLECGRSCVHPDFRSNATIQLLWRGITAYLAHNGLAGMFGCASLEGTDPDKLALPLSYLHHNYSAPPAYEVRARDELYVEMNRMAAEDIQRGPALKSLPPLVKGYVRLGAYVGTGAVIDEQFGTTDVFIMVPNENIAARYFSRFDVDPRGETTGKA